MAFVSIGVLSFVVSKLRKMRYPVKGTITSKYGYRVHPISGEKKLHNGVDIAVPVGTAVQPSVGGVVLSTWTDSGSGNAMKVKLNNGYTLGFAHLSSFVRKTGDRFGAGDVVAKTGNTGNSTGPHLHLTVRDQSGKLIDPETVFEP